MYAHRFRRKAWVERTLYSDPYGITILISTIFIAATVVAIISGVYEEKIQFHKIALITAH